MTNAQELKAQKRLTLQENGFTDTEIRRYLTDFCVWDDIALKILLARMGTVQTRPTKELILEAYRIADEILAIRDILKVEIIEEEIGVQPEAAPNA